MVLGEAMTSFKMAAPWPTAKRLLSNDIDIGILIPVDESCSGCRTGILLADLLVDSDATRPKRLYTLSR